MSDVEADDTFGVREWINDLSYAEIHSAAIGAGLTFGAAIGESPTVLAFSLAIAACALGIRCTNRGKDGDCDHDDGRLSGKLRGQIHRETPYYLGGMVVGDRIGWLAYRYLFESGPAHYEELPEIIRMIATGL